MSRLPPRLQRCGFIFGAALAILIQAMPGANCVAADGPAEAEKQILAMPLRFCDAAAVADTLKAFDDTLVIEVNARTNTLMLRGTREQIDTADAVVKLLEKPARTDSPSVEIEVSLFEQSRVVADDEPITDWESIDADALLDGTVRLKGNSSRADFRLRSINEQTAELQIGGTEAVALGRMSAPGDRGGARTSYQRESVGTLIKVTGLQTESGQILVQLAFEASQLGTPSQPEDPTPTRTLNVQTTVQLVPGKAVIVGGSQTTSNADAGSHLTRSLLVVRARVVKDE